MDDAKKCPVCKSQLEKGFLGLHGGRWTPEKGASAITRFFTRGWPRQTISAYKCPTCGKVELYFEG